MTKETLTELGLTEEQAAKVMEGLNGAFVPKSRFNEVNTELQAAKSVIKERDAQLGALKESTSDAAALKQQISELQAANDAQRTAHETEMKAVRIGNAVDLALTAAKAKNNIAAKALLADFIAKAELSEDGSVKGLDSEIKRLVEGKETAFLFENGSGIQFRGAKAAEKADGSVSAGMSLERLRAMGPAERYAFSASHPDEYRELYGGKK